MSSPSETDARAGPQEAEPFRRRLLDVIEHSRRSDMLGRAFDATMIGLILADVAAAVIDTVAPVHARFGTALALFDAACVGVFVLEYAARLWTAPEHPALRHLPPGRAVARQALRPFMVLDLLVLLPFFVAPFAGAETGLVRVLRVARFVRLARFSPFLSSIIEVVSAEWRALSGCALLFAGLILLAGVGMYLAEGSIQPDKLGDVPSAMWWAVVTLSTVGYGDVVPVTAVGKMVAGWTMIFGLIFFALPIAVIAASFQQQIRRRDFAISFALVARVPLFARLDAPSVARLVGLLTAKRVAAHDVIITKGEEADSMYFIAAGAVVVETPNGPVTLSDGDFFGEVALIHDRVRRSATVVAARTCELLVLGARDFHHLLRQHPEIGAAVQEVAQQRIGSNRQPEPADT